MTVYVDALQRAGIGASCEGSTSLRDFVLTFSGGHEPRTYTPGRWLTFATSDRRGDDAGRLYVFPDGDGAVLWNHRTGERAHWSARRITTPMEKAEFARLVALAEVQRQQSQQTIWRRNREQLRAIWETAAPITEGDPVWLYLRARSLIVTPPPCLRYQAALPYWHEGEMLGAFPAMVARFHSAEGRCAAIHKTYLTPEGRKADVPTVKKMSPSAGVLMGGCIPLTDPGLEVLGVAEGIETALAAGAGSGVPTLATSSAGCLAGFKWPATVRRLVIFADNDENQTGQQAAARLADRARSKGLRVTINTPPQPGTDWADVWAARDEARVEAVADSLDRSHLQCEGDEA